MSFNIGQSGIQAASSGPERHRQQHRQRRHRRLKPIPRGVRRRLRRLGAGFGQQPAGQRRAALGRLADVQAGPNIDSTNSVLDLAINGNGFFVTSNNGAISYTRAGYFNTDKAGFHRRQQRLPPVGLCRRAERPVAERRGHRPQGRARQSRRRPPRASSSRTTSNLDAEAADRDAVRSVRRRYLQLVLFRWASMTARATSHTMSQFFIKNEPDPNATPADSGEQLTMKVLIDGVNHSTCRTRRR